MSLRRGLQYFAAIFGLLVISTAIWQRVAYERVRQSAGPYLSDATGIGKEAALLSQTLTITLALNLLLLVLAWWVLRNRVLKPLNLMRSQLKQVAQGDLHQIIEVSSPREVRAAAYAAERMRRNLVHQLDVAYSAWINAGHPSALIRDTSGAIVELGTTGPMIGGFGGYWNTQTVPFALGDRLLVMTDGVIETRTATGEEYGVDAIAERFASVHSRDDSESAVNSILAKVRRESVTWDKDDITLVSVLRKAKA